MCEHELQQQPCWRACNTPLAMPARPEPLNFPLVPPEPLKQEEALTLAVYLSLVTADPELAHAAGALAEELAAGLDESTVEMCKASALERWEAEEG